MAARRPSNPRPCCCHPPSCDAAGTTRVRFACPANQPRRVIRGCARARQTPGHSPHALPVPENVRSTFDASHRSSPQAIHARAPESAAPLASLGLVSQALSHVADSCRLVVPSGNEPPCGPSVFPRQIKVSPSCHFPFLPFWASAPVIKKNVDRRRGSAGVGRAGLERCRIHSLLHCSWQLHASEPPRLRLFCPSRSSREACGSGQDAARR